MDGVCMYLLSALDAMIECTLWQWRVAGSHHPRVSPLHCQTLSVPSHRRRFQLDRSGLPVLYGAVELFTSSLASLPDLSVVRTTSTPQITTLLFSASSFDAKPLVISKFGKLSTTRQGASTTSYPILTVLEPII